MADITKCSSEHCSQKDSCYRALAKDNDKYQSWYNFEYTCNELSGFDEFIPMYNRKRWQNDEEKR